MISDIANMNREVIEGTVIMIYDDFETDESIRKENAIAFLLETKDDKIIVVYDKGAYKLGLIKIGKPLVCFGFFQGKIKVKEKDEPKFIGLGIVVSSEELTNERLIDLGAITLEDYMKKIEKKNGKRFGK